MKKIFTILAAGLFGVSMMAQTTVFNWSATESECVGSVTFGTSDFSVGTVKIHENKDEIPALKLNTGFKFADNKFITIEPASGSFKAGDILSIAVCFNNSDDSKVAVVKIYAADGTELFTTQQGVNGRKSADDPVVETFTLEADAEALLLGRAGNTATYVPTLFVTNPAPVSDPVTEVTIAGEEACYVGKTITLVANTDVTADAYKWAVNGEEQEGAESKSFNFTPEEEGTFAIVCFAKNEHNADWVESDAHEVEATVKEVLTQVDVTESIIWDWTKAAAVSEIKWTDETTPAKGETVLLANVDDFNNDENFYSQALLFAGEYPVRGGSYCQGSLLQFRTTVAGSVKVEFSNTGGGDRPERYVAVNGVVNTTVGSNTSDKVESADIPVAAGDVKIEGRFENYDDGAQYLRVYKVTFTKSTETAIDNAEVNAKAQKIVENGQLMIIKNGVKYNAQGVAVK